MTLVHNTGIAFGLFKNHGIVFVIIPAIAVVLLVFNIYYYRNHKDLSQLYIVAISLILGGAIGNLIDRIFFGYVIDFINIHVLPVFNVADMCIDFGVFLFILEVFLVKNGTSRPS